MSDERRPLEGPSIAYWPPLPGEGNPLCEATKDLLLWMRNQCFRADHIEVTDKGVLIHGLVDIDPATAARTGGSSPKHPGPTYDRDYPDE